ncbi:MAG: glycoside hydrolase family 99-like domain-containing protein [Armatimonadota bacterium]
MRTIASSVIAAWVCAAALAQGDGRPLIEWHFEGGDLEGWGWPNHITDLRVEDGALGGTIADWDPFVVSPRFDVPATAWQVVELRLKTDLEGTGEILWTNTTETQYGGFSPGKETPFAVQGDGEWHTYRVRPYWHTEGSIILLRLDLPRPEPAQAGQATFALDFVRIIDLGEPERVRTEPSWDLRARPDSWAPEGDLNAVATPQGVRVSCGEAGGMLVSEPLRVPVNGRLWVSMEMAVDRGASGAIRWVSSDHAGMQTRRFELRPDGRFRVYNVDMSPAREWCGELLLLGLSPSLQAGATATIRSVSVAEEPQGPAQVEVTWAGLENAINRAGRRLPFVISLRNYGGTPARDLRIARLRLPEGMRAVGEGWRRLHRVDPFAPVSHRFEVVAHRPLRGEAVVALSGAGAPADPLRVPVEVTAPLGLPLADYVPEPRPVPCEYEIGAYYFPGWATRARWQPVEQTAPERRPVLGWYDEANPECVDWQIKWAVEHGISFFMVDWYWSAGSRRLEHWLHEGYMNARYRSYLKWCVMWANHNPPGTHSEADQRAVTQYWLDHYFGMDEYYRVGGKPVVIIWSPGRMRGDMGGSEGVRRLLEISQQMARAAGYPGICFVAMKFPEASTDPALVRQLADEGFEMTTIYHYMGHGGEAADPQNYPFELVARSTYPFLRAWHAADILPFFPAISTGWDSRPWHGESATVIHGRSVELFRDLCADVRRLADETGLRRIAVGPLNEWGEGSYLEPCREFGFAMYDALRDAFCAEPPGGWPPNIAPCDVGLGPYDLPAPQPRLSWDFEDGAHGWGPLMGIRDFAAAEGAISFVTTSHDPALTVAVADVRAEEIAQVVIRMRIDGLAEEGEPGQLFWSTSTAAVSEATSLRFELTPGEQFRDYVLPVGESERWRGTISSLRLDPCAHAGAQVAIDEIRLVPREP